MCVLQKVMLERSVWEVCGRQPHEVEKCHTASQAGRWPACLNSQAPPQAAGETYIIWEWQQDPFSEVLCA